MRIVPLLWVLTGLAWPAAQSAEVAELYKIVEPAAVALEPSKLAAMDELISAEVEAGKIVGCMALVAREDQVAYLKTWGDRDREADKPMTPDTIFRIYSMTKPVTSVATMQLIESHRMGLDEPVSKYLPELAELKVLVEAKQDDGEKQVDEIPANRPITVRDLLRHTSGLTYGFFGDTEVDQRYRRAGVLVTDTDIEETVTKLSKLPLLYQPGARWHYSVSTDVLGRLVEVVSRQRFDEYLREHVFAPLEMHDTFFSVPEDQQERLAQMYAPDGAGALEPAAARRSRRFVNTENRFFSGGGGLCSTTYDYFRFCRMLLREGELDGQRLLKAESVRQMTTNQLDEDVQRRGGFQFGLGFAISPEGEYSWGGAAGTRFWINPKRKLIGIYMIQINPYRAKNYGNQMKQIVYDADIRPLSPVSATPATVAPIP